jgi:hypothetical protein
LVTASNSIRSGVLRSRQQRGGTRMLDLTPFFAWFDPVMVMVVGPFQVLYLLCWLHGPSAK